MARVAAFGVLLVASACGVDEVAPTPNTASQPEVFTGPRPQDLASDSRIASLPRDCHQIDPFLYDTSDTLGILVRKLERGDAEVLGRACEELGAMGAAAVPTLSRRLAAEINDPARVHFIQNTIRALGLNQDPSAVDALVRALGHPSPPIRSQVLGILAKRTLAPHHYEAVLDAAYFEGGNGQTNALRAMWSADRERAANQIIEWFTQDRAPNDESAIGGLLASIDEPELLARLFAASDFAPSRFQPYIDVALHAAGDEAAFDRTVQRLLHGAPDERGAVLFGAVAADTFDLLDWIARDDRAPELRTLAVNALEPFLDGADDVVRDRARARLTAALDDPADSVQQAALEILVRARDPAGIDRALARLTGSRRDMESILTTLHFEMVEDPQLAARARALVEEELSSSEGRHDGGRNIHLLQALALCTGADVVDRILDSALAAPAGTVVENLPVHQFLAIQTANSGVAGRARVVERLASETEPRRRIDLLWAIGSHRDELARESLAAHLELDDIAPWERVYAAHLLALIGPTSFAAPLVKAAARRVDDPEARRAIDCLLWRWY